MYFRQYTSFPWPQKDGWGKYPSHPESLSGSLNAAATGWCENRAVEALALGSHNKHATSAIRPPAAREEAAGLPAGTGTAAATSPRPRARELRDRRRQLSSARTRPSAWALQGGRQQAPSTSLCQRAQSPLLPKVPSDAG